MSKVNSVDIKGGSGWIPQVIRNSKIQEHVLASWENLIREAAAKHIEEVPQWGVVLVELCVVWSTLPRGCQVSLLREPNEMVLTP